MSIFYFKYILISSFFRILFLSRSCPFHTFTTNENSKKKNSTKKRYCTHIARCSEAEVDECKLFKWRDIVDAFLNFVFVPVTKNREVCSGKTESMVTYDLLNRLQGSNDALFEENSADTVMNVVCHDVCSGGFSKLDTTDVTNEIKDTLGSTDLNNVNNNPNAQGSDAMGLNNPQSGGGDPEAADIGGGNMGGGDPEGEMLELESIPLEFKRAMDKVDPFDKKEKDAESSISTGSTKKESQSDTKSESKDSPSEDASSKASSTAKSETTSSSSESTDKKSDNDAASTNSDDSKKSGPMMRSHREAESPSSDEIAKSSTTKDDVSSASTTTKEEKSENSNSLTSTIASFVQMGKSYTTFYTEMDAEAEKEDDNDGSKTVVPFTEEQCIMILQNDKGVKEKYEQIEKDESGNEYDVDDVMLDTDGKPLPLNQQNEKAQSKIAQQNCREQVGKIFTEEKCNAILNKGSLGMGQDFKSLVFDQLGQTMDNERQKDISGHSGHLSDTNLANCMEKYRKIFNQEKCNDVINKVDADDKLDKEKLGEYFQYMEDEIKRAGSDDNLEDNNGAVYNGLNRDECLEKAAR